MKAVEIIVIGAGDRGTGYAIYANKFPGKAKIVGVAEPDDFRRNQMVETYDIPQENVFKDWKEVVEKEKFADAVIIATQDKMHTEPAVKFAELGYHILLEKPMAPTVEECETIVNAAKKNKVMFSVCHVLRYTNYSQKLKQLLVENIIGDIISIQHLEPVGFWHQAHSFVRGNWRNSEESNFMLLAKSCHDLDWISFIMGDKCKKVSSFGNLKYFKKENQPDGAADRCLDCPSSIEATCPYSAKAIYFGCWNKGYRGWPLTVITDKPSPESIETALREGPYGRCAFACDNDVVDHQVVNFEFENGATGSFTMTAFTELTDRRTRIFGTRGEIEGDGRFIKIYDFINQKRTEIDTYKENAVLKGHGGGDFGLMDNFVNAILNNDPESIITGPDATLESHQMVFAAEKARNNESVIKL